MPLYKTIHITPTTEVSIWKIEESFEDLAKDLTLSSESKTRLETLKTEPHKKQLLSIRQLLKLKGVSDDTLYHDANGKPHLKNNQHISISHSHNYAAVIISDTSVGIDLEKKQDKIIRLANKFTPLSEYKTIANDTGLIRKLTIVWCAKEAIYKAVSIPGLSFLNDIYVDDFNFEDLNTSAHVNVLNQEKSFRVNFIEFDDFSCVYVLTSATA